jgi:hypothetical protein
MSFSSLLSVYQNLSFHLGHGKRRNSVPNLLPKLNFFFFNSKRNLLSHKTWHKKYQAGRTKQQHNTKESEGTQQPHKKQRQKKTIHPNTPEQ